MSYPIFISETTRISKRPVVIGVTGGTGYGKTTVVIEILRQLDSSKEILPSDPGHASRW